MKHAWCIYLGGKKIIVWKSVPVLDNVSVNFNSTLNLFWTLPGRKETWSKDTLPSRKRWKCTPNASKRWKRKAPLNCSERLVNRLIKFINLSVCNIPRTCLTTTPSWISMLTHLMASPWRDTCTRELATPSRPGAGELDLVESPRLTRGRAASTNKDSKTARRNKTAKRRSFWRSTTI